MDDAEETSRMVNHFSGPAAVEDGDYVDLARNSLQAYFPRVRDSSLFEMLAPDAPAAIEKAVSETGATGKADMGENANTFMDDEVCYTNVLADHGWTCGLSGKWHLGSEGPCLPQRQGFDSAFYIDRSRVATCL